MDYDPSSVVSCGGMRVHPSTTDHNEWDATGTREQNYMQSFGREPHENNLEDPDLDGSTILN
jgi:hypothetical protein